MKNIEILTMKPTHLGLSILQLSNMLMHEFSHDNLKPKYGLKIKLW